MRVIEIADNSIAASYCGRVLYSLGNEVTKIEPPGEGDGLRRRGPFEQDRPNEAGGIFAALNYGKRSVTLDPATPRGMALLASLLEESDVVVHGLQPAVAASLGIDPSGVNERYPKLIAASLSGYGAQGPYSGYRSYPINSGALGGVSVGIGRPKERPLAVPFELGQYEAGLVAAIGILGAVLALPEVGGQSVDVAEADIWATCQTGPNILTFLYLGIAGIRAGNHGIGPYPNSFLGCKDGYMCVTLTPLAQWMKLQEIMGTPEWTKLPRYRNRRAMTEEYPDEVDVLVKEWLGQYTRAEVFEKARAAGLPVVPAMTVADLLEHEHLEARREFIPIKTDGKSYKVPRLPFVMSRDGELSRTGPVPGVGEHTAEVLGKLGVSPEELERLFECEVI